MTVIDLTIPLGRDGLPDVEELIRQGKSRSEALKIWAQAVPVPDDPHCMFSPPKSLQ